MVYWQLTRSHMLIGFLMLLLVANVLLYQPGIQSLLSIKMESSVVIGSLIDLAIVAPIIARFAFRLSWKTTAALMAMGLVTARFLVPAEFFEPYNGLLYAGIVAEGVIVAFELGLLFILLKRIPAIVKEMNGEPALYAMLPVKEGKLYVAQGLTKRIIVPIEAIKDVKWGLLHKWKRFNLYLKILNR